MEKRWVQLLIQQQRRLEVKKIMCFKRTVKFLKFKFWLKSHNNNNNNNNSSYKAHNTAIASLCAGKEEKNEKC